MLLVLRLSSLLTVFALVASAWLEPAVDARAMVQSKRAMQQQELGAASEAEQEPMISEGLRDKIANEPWLRAQVRKVFLVFIYLHIDFV